MEPKIRFKGFEGEWKEVKLGDIAKFSKGQGYSKSDLKETGHPIILYGRMYTKYRFAIDEVDTFANLKDSSILSEGNEIIMPSSGETPEDIACASAVLAKEIILGGDLNIMHFDLTKFSTSYIALVITYGKTHHDLSKCAQGKSVVHLHNGAISKAIITLPSLAEQQAIASYFTSLDSQISASTSRLASLKQMKAASLQTMFPQEGETVPKIRFQNNRWQKYKVGDLCDLLTGYPFPGDKILTKGKDLLMRGINITEGSIRHSNEIDRYYNEDTIGLEKYRLQVGDLVIGMDGSKVGKNSALVTSKEKNSLLVQRVARLRNEDKNLIKLIQIAVSSDNFIKYVEEMKTSSAIPHISPADIRNFPLSLPEDSNERRLIASYFTSLDRQISLQSQRLEKLKQIKSASLDKMFV